MLFDSATMREKKNLIYLYYKSFQKSNFYKNFQNFIKKRIFKYLFAFTSFHLLSLFFTKFYKLSFKKVYKSVHTDLTASK